VKLRYVFAYHMYEISGGLVRQHRIRVTNDCEVVGQGIKPHINRLGGIPGDSDAPVNALSGSRYRNLRFSLV